MSIVSKQKETLYTIAKRELAHNKLFSSLIIMSIILASTLLMGAFLITGQISKVNSSRMGTWMALYQTTDIQVIEQLSKEEVVMKSGKSVYLDSIEFNNYQINLTYADENAFELSGLIIKEGKMPTAPNDILIEFGMKNEQGEKIKVGDKLDLQSKFGLMNVCGIFTTVASEMDRGLYGAFVSNEYINTENPLSQILYLSMNTIKKNELQDQLMDLKEKYNLDHSFVINDDYLNSKGTGWIYKLVSVGLGIIILMVAYLTIYCIYFIAVVNSVKEIGQLKLIGASDKQIFHITYYKFLILLLIGVPIGCLIGGMTCYFAVPEVFNIRTYAWIVILVIVLITIIVMRAAKRPLIIVKSISLIESSKFSGIDKFKEKTRGKRISPSYMARIYRQRYKKKNNLTVTLLVLCGTMFLVCSSILGALDAKAMSRQNFLEEDCHILINSELMRDLPLEKVQMNNPLSDELLKEIEKIDGVEKIWEQMCLPISFENEEQSSGAILSLTKSDYDRLERCASEGILPTYEEWGENEVVIGRPELFKEYFGFNVKSGDLLELYIYDGNQKKEIQLDVIGVLDEKKSTEEKFDVLIMPDRCMQSKADTNIRNEVFIKTNDSEKTYQEIVARCNNIKHQVEIENLPEVTEQNEMFMFSFKFVIYVILAFIAIFSIINLFNTLLTNIVVRKRELMMMQMLGLTKTQLRKMLICESGFVVTKSMILISILGTVLGKILCTVMVNSGFSYMVYKIPVLPIVVCILVSGIVAFLATGIIGIKFVYKSPTRKRKVQSMHELYKTF